MSLVEPYITVLSATFGITVAVVSTTLQLLWWPVSRLLHALIFILSPFWNIFRFLLLPFIRFGQAIASIITSPFSVKWLERIETLYVFLGTAALIGCITGAIIFIIFRFLSSGLKIDASIVPSAADRGRTTGEYRAAKRVKKEGTTDHSPLAGQVVLRKASGPRRRGLSSQAIIEEDDSDY